MVKQGLCNVASKNKLKNRYSNLFPFDQNVVELEVRLFLCAHKTLWGKKKAIYFYRSTVRVDIKMQYFLLCWQDGSYVNASWIRINDDICRHYARGHTPIPDPNNVRRCVKMDIKKKYNISTFSFLNQSIS